MCKVISITNQKGGVGKTTSAVNISAALGAKGKKVLLVDFDPQGNATSGYGISKKNLKTTSYDVVMSNVRPQEAVLATNCKNVSLILQTLSLQRLKCICCRLNREITSLKKL